MFKWLRALGRRGKTPQHAAAADERPRKRPKKCDGVAARVQRNVERDGGGGGGDEAARGRHREDSDARDVDARDGGAEREDVVEDDDGAEDGRNGDEEEGDEEEGDEEEDEEEEGDEEEGDEDDDDDDDDYENENEDDDDDDDESDDEDDDEDDDENDGENENRKTAVRKRRMCCVCRDRLGCHSIHRNVFGRTHVQLIGKGSTTVTLKRNRKLRLDSTATFGQGDVICRACAALTYTDFLVSMDNVRFANVLEDERKLLLLAEHLRTNPETITTFTEVKLAGWKTPSSPVRSIEVGDWLCSVCKRYPRRLEELEKSPNDDVKKATAEVLRLTSEFQDARRVLLLAEHLRTNPETITTCTEIELAGWKTPSSPERSIKVGSWLRAVCKLHPRRLEALENSRFDDVKKATAEVLRLTSDFQDARRVLLLAEHLRTNPETITTCTKIELAGWKTPSSPVRSIKVGCWLCNVCKRYPHRLEALEKSRFDDVKKATAEVLRT